MTGLIVGVSVIAVLVGVAGVVAAAETGLTRMSRSRAESLEPEEGRSVGALVDLLDDRESTLSPLLLLRVASHGAIASVSTVLVVDRAANEWLVPWAFAVIAGVYILAEAIPRTWALQHPDRAALVAAPVVRFVLRVAPVRFATRLLNAVANRILPGPARAPVVSEDELMALTEAAVQADAIDSEERDLIESVLALGDTVVREVMVPRTDMVTADVTMTVTAALELASDRGLSRMPVSGTGVDDIVGIVLLKDLAKSERSGEGGEPLPIAMRRASFVPETKRADELLREMRTAGGHLAVIVDEYGGTAGLVTLEDLVEELVGEIVDEFDREEPLLEPLSGGEALVHGRMPVDQLNSLVDADLPDDDWDTVGGLIFDSFGRVPNVGESIDVDGLRLRVERMQGRRITRVRLTRVRTGSAGDAES